MKYHFLNIKNQPRMLPSKKQSMSPHTDITDSHLPPQISPAAASPRSPPPRSTSFISIPLCHRRLHLRLRRSRVRRGRDLSDAAAQQVSGEVREHEAGSGSRRRGGRPRSQAPQGASSCKVHFSLPTQFPVQQPILDLQTCKIQMVMTPLLTSQLAGQFVAVDPAGLFMSTVQVVLAPVLVGALLNQYCNALVEIFSPVMPFIAVATVAILCGSAIAQNASAILRSGLQVIIAVISLHGSGFFFGYVFSRMLGIDVSSSRTISIEVGMQNSVLGVVFAGQHFGNPLTAFPCAVSSVCHSVYGSVLAGIWRCMPPSAEVKD